MMHALGAHHPHVHHHHHAAAAAAAQHSQHADFLSSLELQSPLDVYDIHEAGWRRAILLGKRDRHEYLVRYTGWDSKWDEWIRATAGRMAPANSKTATIAYTGFKGPKTADEVASVELGRDWNLARQEGVMCDVLFALHVGQPHRRAGHRMVSVHGTPTKSRSNNLTLPASQRKEDSEYKSSSGAAAAAAASNGASAAASACNTPATSPMVRGMSGMGLMSPRLAPTSPALASAAPPPLIFSAHRQLLDMRCPDLLKSSVISLPPLASFSDERETMAPYLTPFQGPRASPTSEGERKEDAGGRSLADQEAAAAGVIAPSAILPTQSFSLLHGTPSASPDSPAIAGGGAVAPSSAALEEKSRSLDEDDDMIAAAGLLRSSSFSRGGGAGTPQQQRGFSELHPSVQTLEVHCIAQASTMSNLLTYLYTGELSMYFLQTSVHLVFELATAAHLLHLDRLLDLCSLALNRMLTENNVLQALKCALHFQTKVLGNLEQICSELSDAASAATASLAQELHASHSSMANAKIHPRLSPLVRVCLEYMVLHWDVLWSSSSNLSALQALPPALFATIMRMLPLRHVSHAAFSPIYPTVHPQQCTLASHFKRLYEGRTVENTDFSIVIGDDEAAAIRVHKSVLACRSEYFRALFRCSFEEGQESVLRLDAEQHSQQSMQALIKFLYCADLKVDPSCGVYLSNCTHFFGLSSNALENACQELVSQHHCVQVLKAAWKSCNEGLFKRACKFIDWTTLATLMNGRGSSARASGAAGAAAGGGDEEGDMDDDASDVPSDQSSEVGDGGAGAAAANVGEADDFALEDAEGDAAEDEEAEAMAADTADGEGEDVPAGASAAASASSSAARVASQSAASAAAAAAAASSAESDDTVSMWKAIVAEKAHPTMAAGALPFGKKRSNSASLKRARAPE